jgi:hypothetical protein
MPERYKYSDPHPATKLGRVRTALMQLHGEHRRAGTLPTSARFLFYELIARRAIRKNDDYVTQLVSNALMQLRERGLIPWDDIVDETRRIVSFTGSATVAEDWLRFLPSARLDPWHGDIPFVITESRSLAGVLRGLVQRYRAEITSSNGQVGGFLRTDIGPALAPGDRIGYLGDLDLAGGDIENNTRTVLEEIVGGPLQWERLAITPQQVRRHRLETIIKVDERFKRNRSRGRHEAVETEALSQALIIQIVERWLKELLPQPLEPLLQREQRERIRLRRLVTARRSRQA